MFRATCLSLTAAMAANAAHVPIQQAQASHKPTVIITRIVSDNGGLHSDNQISIFNAGSETLSYEDISIVTTLNGHVARKLELSEAAVCDCKDTLDIVVPILDFNDRHLYPGQQLTICSYPESYDDDGEAEAVAIREQCDLFASREVSNIMQYNGNDAIEVRIGDERTDIFGDDTSDRVNNVCGIKYKHATYVRKSNVCQGNLEVDDSFDKDHCEWDVYTHQKKERAFNFPVNERMRNCEVAYNAIHSLGTLHIYEAKMLSEFNRIHDYYGRDFPLMDDFQLKDVTNSPQGAKAVADQLYNALKKVDFQMQMGVNSKSRIEPIVITNVGDIKPQKGLNAVIANALVIMSSGKGESMRNVVTTADSTVEMNDFLEDLEGYEGEEGEDFRGQSRSALDWTSSEEKKANDEIMRILGTLKDTFYFYYKPDKVDIRLDIHVSGGFTKDGDIVGVFNVVNDIE